MRGDLTVDGVYDDYKDSDIGILIVLGDMKVNHLYSWGTLSVLGNVTASGLIYNEYNDYVFETSGDISCKAFYVSDKQAIYNSLNAEFERGYDGIVNGPNITDFFVSAVLEEDDDWEEYYEKEEVNEYTSLNSSSVKQLLYNGKNIFKS